MSCAGCTLKNNIDFNRNEPKKDSFITGCNNLNTHDWLQDLPDTSHVTDMVEVRFKGTRKDFYKNINNLPLKRGDLVAVEASPGHDIGTVTLTGQLVKMQLKRKNTNLSNREIKGVYRLARYTDIEKWKQAQSLEHNTMIKAREIAREMNLDMKIGDVEYQGDKTKAIFYYIADNRVDFRELIKVYAQEFDVRIEMKQIGARQEAGLIGGIGSCGRELCCSTWLTNFSSVPTNVAKFQELPLNAQKLAGQCGKLKCCLMYELEHYLEAKEDFPEELLELETDKGTAYHHKTDILTKTIWYSYSKSFPTNLTPLSIDRVKEIIQLNKRGIKVEDLVEKKEEKILETGYVNDVGTDDPNRFKAQKKSRKKHTRNKKQKGFNTRGMK